PVATQPPPPFVPPCRLRLAPPAHPLRRYTLTRPISCRTMSRHAAAEAVRAAATAVLAVAAFALFTLTPEIGYAVACLTEAAGAALNWPPALGTDVAPRALLAAGVTHLADTAGYPAAAVVVAGVLLVGLPVVEPLVRRLARPWYQAAHLPATPGLPAALDTSGAAWGVQSAAL